MTKQLLALCLLISFSATAVANDTLCTELSTDPLGRGYSGMTADQAAADLMSEYRTRWKSCVDGSALLDAIDASDWNAITDSQRDRALSLLAIGCLDPQGNAKTLMIRIFGSGSQTLVNMAAESQDSISRADELGLGKVRAGDVESCQL